MDLIRSLIRIVLRNWLKSLQRNEFPLLIIVEQQPVKINGIRDGHFHGNRPAIQNSVKDLNGIGPILEACSDWQLKGGVDFSEQKELVLRLSAHDQRSFRISKKHDIRGDIVAVEKHDSEERSHIDTIGHFILTKLSSEVRSRFPDNLCLAYS